jgi:hypothetical protein
MPREEVFIRLKEILTPYYGRLECFNFSHVDEALFGELADLTNRGLERFGALGVQRHRT